MSKDGFGGGHEETRTIYRDKPNNEEGLYEAAKAYRALSSCYRTGAQPSEKLFKALNKANKLLKEYEAKLESR